MTPEEIRVRSVYLFLACSQAVEQVTAKLAATVPSPPLSMKLLVEKALRRELGLLFRYWTTRQIWERLEANEENAKALNLALLRLFTNAFGLPKDGSGLRYAELSTLGEELHELAHRIANAVGTEQRALLDELQRGMLPWRDAILRHTAEALEKPLEQLTPSVRTWAERAPGASEGDIVPRA
jgi:hypothetical protein